MLDRKVFIFDARTGKEVGRLLSYSGEELADVAVSPDGKLVATVDESDTVYVWKFAQFLKPWYAPTNRTEAAMETGQSVAFEGTVYTDEVSDAKVRRLTSPEYMSVHQYFYLNMWMPDSRRVLISSNMGDKIFRHYLVDVETGEAVCLTDTDRLSAHFGELAHDGSHLFYAAGRELRRRDLASMDEETIYSQEDPWTGRCVYYGATADHSRVVMVEMHKDDIIPAKDGWDAFPKQFAAKPRCRLVELDTITGEWDVIHESNCWLGHPNYRPDGRTVMFCHEGPWQLVDSRLWFIDPDGANLREGKQRAPGRPPGEGTGEFWGHEFWLADSSQAGYIYFPQKYGIDATLRLLDPETLEETIWMPVSSYSHFITNKDASKIVGDGEVPLADAIFIVDTATQEEKVLCKHGSSMQPWKDERSGRPDTQAAHPHPCFSPDGKKVVFSSDKDGKPAVYVVATT
ncbi:MAG: PD40 domain-containing protein [Planctomycetes bacterium]|nr:PD40 domain-containing protein [Planctomycetota bacterium]